MTMNSEHYIDGIKAYHAGEEILNVPSYLTDKEKEDWVQGYELAMYEMSKPLYNDERDSVEVEELDFQS